MFRCLNTLTNVFDTNKRVLTVLRWILKALQPLTWGFPSAAQRDIYTEWDLGFYAYFNFIVLVNFVGSESWKLFNIYPFPRHWEIPMLNIFKGWRAFKIHRNTVCTLLLIAKTLVEVFKHLHSYKSETRNSKLKNLII